jgi:phage tail sheath protein FI
MAEYLSPGVYIEEVPSSLKAIEGVSTSTAAFVGPAARGPVPGSSLPFKPAGGFVLTPDPAPVLVTSFAEFQRTFGPPLPIAAPGDPTDYGYLGHSVRAFFNNGGLRAYIARIVNTAAAAASTVTVAQGVAYRLLRDAQGTDPLTVYLTSTRGLNVGAAVNFFRHSDGTNPFGGPVTITAYDVQANSIKFANPQKVGLAAGDVYAIAAALNQGAGPKFSARSPGSWGASVSVRIANSDRQPVPVTGAVAVNGTQVPVQNVSTFYIGGSVEIDHNGAGRSLHQIKDINAGTRQLTIDPPLPAPALATPSATVRLLEIDIIVDDVTGVAPTESYLGMAWAQGGFADVRRHYAWTINASSRLVWVQPPPAVSEDYTLTHQPTTTGGFAVPLTGGADGLPTSDDDWLGVDNGPGQRSGIESLQDLSDASLILAPGKTTAAVQLALIAQCELLRYRFAILDGESDPAGGSLTSILTHRNLYDTSYAAYYQPWVTVTLDGQTRNLPPSGFLAGIYARVDDTRGVWKAPANEPVLTVTGLKTLFTTGEQDLLNPRGVNLIRQFDLGGIRVWGARTLSSDPDVKYINVRRTLIFLEASLDQGTQWVVFEPNSPDTWTRVTDSVSAFLLTQWRAGALLGRQPEQAFFVRCDETTMTADDILNGRLICQIGVAIVRPAEFVIFRIQQITNFGAAAA